MNFKKTAIALAVASVASAPIVASADGSVYASVRIGLQVQDSGDDTEATIRGFGSRFGIRGETDLGNGLTAWGRYEFGVATEGDGPNVSRRWAVVGLKGDFGNIYLGQAYHTWYNHIVVGADYPWWGSGYAAQLAYRGRTDESITYAGDFGPVSFGITGVLQADGNGGNQDSGGDSENIDEYEIAISFDAGPVRVGFGILGEEGATESDAVAAVAADPTSDPIVVGTAGSAATPVNDEPIYGFSIAFDAGPVALAGNYMLQERGSSDASSIVINAAISNFYAHLELGDGDGAAFASGVGEDPVYITLGYTHNIGPRTLMYFEISDFDKDTGNSNDDDTRGRAVLKYDIL